MMRQKTGYSAADHLWREIDDFCELNGIEDSFGYAAGNCGMLADGSCMHAGSEDCEWECPFRAEQRARMRRQKI